MKIESTGFTEANLNAFAADFIEHERGVLADRLARASARLAALASGVQTTASGQGDDWTAHEILAHIAVFSKFYGMLTYKVGSGQLHEIDLLGSIQQRDIANAQYTVHSPAELLETIQTSHQRTVEYLRSTDAEAMQRRLDAGNGLSVSVDQIARLFLCAHLEQHIDHLAATLHEAR